MVMHFVRFLAGIISFFIGTFPLAYLWHLSWFHQTYLDIECYTNFEDPTIEFGVLAILIQGVILSFIYPSISGIFATSNQFVQGIFFGIISGLYMITVQVFAHAAKNKCKDVQTFIIYESAFLLIQFTTNGLLFSVVHGKQNWNDANQSSNNTASKKSR